MTCPVPPPETICDHHTALILSSLRDYIGIHSPVFDEEGKIIDTELVWWNEPYEAIRTSPPHLNQTMTSTYFEPHEALSYVRKAWENESTPQVFELSEDTVDRYRPPEVIVRIEVTWLRAGGLVIEIGSDLSEMTALELELVAQRQAYLDATREALLNAERTRIGHDLHDSVIQDLFAITLRLQAQRSEPWVTDAIHDVISGIRSTIFEIEPSSNPPARARIEKVIESFASAWPNPVVTNIKIAREMPDDIMNDVENVLREGLSNAARHARATQVTVEVVVSADALRITITDDGIGPHGLKRRKAGTLSLARRAESHQGTFAISGAPGGGSLLEWACPLP